MKQRLLFLITFVLLFDLGLAQKNQPSFNARSLEKGMKYIPGGSLILPNTDAEFVEDENGDFRIIQDSIRVAAFYLSDHEVSNGEYRVFLEDIKMTDLDLYNVMYPDTLAWQKPPYLCTNCHETYFQSIEYENFPLLCVSYEQALEYCKWLTNKYTSSQKPRYPNVQFTLPAKNQWLMAANGRDGSIKNFPFEDWILRPDKKGMWPAKFNVVPQTVIFKAEKKVICDDSLISSKHSIYTVLEFNGFNLDPSDFLSKVKSHKPSKNGFYNMGGNAEEMVLEKGVTKGGSWFDTGYYLQNRIQQDYPVKASNEIGFRVAMLLK